MAQDIEIQCINKIPRNDPFDRIQGVGGVHLGKKWWLSHADAIRGIKDGKWSFYVGSTILTRVNVVIKVSRYGNEYLTTEADGESQNNLLSLVECS